MNGMSISVDVSSWLMPVRIELLEFIDALDARVAGQERTSSDTIVSGLPDVVEPSGWNQEAYRDVITKLLSRHHVQAAVIFEAIKNGSGYVSRERVYELGNYPAGRSLKGFTRPVNRLTAEAVEAALLPEDADDLLAPDYDPNVSGFQRAKGFIVPAEIVKMALEWREETVRD